MAANAKAPNWKRDRWGDLVLDVAVPLFFAVVTAGFLALAAQ